MKYFLIAGEASGDIHAADLITALRRDDPEAEIRFLGGDLMAAAAGRQPEIHYREMAYMGFIDVVKNLGKVKRNLHKAKEIIDTFRPDALILIDYPSFNLRMARYARRRGIKSFYYISPKVWAWKEYRVKAIKRDIDRVFSILPFEQEFYRRHGMEVEYVGNPSVVEIDAALKAPSTLAESGLQAPLLALVPGSRQGEIATNLPIMAAVAKRHPKYNAVIAGAPAIDEAFYRQYTDLPVVSGHTFDLMRDARAALVTSGTATLECALSGTPQVACFRSTGSRTVYNIMSHILKIPFVTLPNLIVGREVIPEMLLHHCNVDEVDRALSPLLSDSAERRTQLDGYREMRRRLGTHHPADTTAKAIISNLKS